MRIGAALLAALSFPSLHAAGTLTASPDGLTVTDSANHITWLADFNFPATNRFGLPLCNGANNTKACINASGSMSYQAAAAWVAAMNAANYLGHSNWQLPTTPILDNGCGFIGPQNNSFGFGCAVNALGSLYYNALGIQSPNTAVPILNSSAGPFTNLQPYLYWSQSVSAGTTLGRGTFSFNTGFLGSNTTPNYLYALPMVPGKIPGTPAATGTTLQVNPGGQTVYDPVTNVTWLANANVAATNSFGLPPCKNQGTPKLCVNSDGAMNFDSATQLVANLNAAAYLGQTNWQLPPVDASCGASYNCATTANPMGELFYSQLGLTAGSPAVSTPNIAVGPFRNLQPYLYWSCEGATIQNACETDGPAIGFEWSFSFGNGFLGTDVLQNEFYVTAYFPGTRVIPPAPVISLVANAEGENPTIAPNTWIEIKGSNLAPVISSPDCAPGYCWQGSDFIGSQMPTKLDGVSVSVNGKAAFVYYISPGQINVLTPPDAMSGNVIVQVNNNGTFSAGFSVNAAALSPSFFVFNGGPYIVAEHSDFSLIGPTSLFPGLTTPARPNETVVIYANGFGATTPPVVSGLSTQTGTLSPLPKISIGGIDATVKFAGLITPGLFQFNVIIPANVGNGDNAVVATYNGAQTPVERITIQGGIAPTSVTLFVAPNGKDTWSGNLAAPNSTNTDGPLATFDRARAMVQSISKAGLTQITVQFRGGTYYLPATELFTAADSGSPTLKITYQNYPGESPVFSGGVRLQNWTNSGNNKWTTTLPASTQYFENLFYNGTRRLRPRLGATAASPLGTYYRVANTVYLPAQAGNCAVNIPNLGWECFDRFQYSASDPIAGTWKNLAAATGNLCTQAAGNQTIAGDIELLIWEQFSTSKLRVSCIDTVNRIVYLMGRTGMSQTNASEEGFIQGNRYLIENVQDALTLPGQWFLDRSTTPWTLTYLSNSGENPNTDNVIIPQLPQVLVGSSLQYVTFQGLTFEHDNYTLPALGHISSELEADVSAAVSFQNSQHITFDSGIVTQTSGSGLEFIPCLNNASAQAYCVATNLNAVITGNIVQNSAFFDIGALGIRIGEPYVAANTDANVPQSTLVQNNVVEGYGRTIPASFGIGQGMGHDNLYTHNDVYDGYHCAISTSQSIAENTKPSGIGNANNVISFNHVYNLLQGIMNDGGSIRVDGGNSVFTAAGNKILNNKIHDVTDASIMDSNGYGGHGVYMDDQTGLTDVENNLVYRVSGYAIYTPHGPFGPGTPNTIKNNILAYARMAMIGEGDPYQNGVPPVEPQSFLLSNNLIYFDQSEASSQPFRIQGGCSYAGGSPYTSYQLFGTNLYWRTDGAFASDAKAFHVQPAAGTGDNAPCSQDKTTWTFFTLAQWQQSVGEDLHSVVQDPGFKNPAYPADDYSLPKGSPGVGFVVFDPNQAGRTNPVIKPPAIAPTFPIKLFNPATDY